MQVLFEYSRQIGLDLGQVGYQAIASGCNHYKDGMALLDKMEVCKSTLLLSSGPNKCFYGNRRTESPLTSM